MLTGRLIAESLRVGAELAVPGLRLTGVSRHDVSASARGSQPTVWTFVDFEADDEVAGALADALAETLLAEGGWYADFRLGDEHVVAYSGRHFRYRRGDRAGRDAAVEHGRTVGVPVHQLDWPV